MSKKKERKVFISYCHVGSRGGMSYGNVVFTTTEKITYALIREAADQIKERDMASEVIILSWNILEG